MGYRRLLFLDFFEVIYFLEFLNFLRRPRVMLFFLIVLTSAFCLYNVVKLKDVSNYHYATQFIDKQGDSLEYSDKLVKDIISSDDFKDIIPDNILFAEDIYQFNDTTSSDLLRFRYFDEATVYVDPYKNIVTYDSSEGVFEGKLTDKTLLIDKPLSQYVKERRESKEAKYSSYVAYSIFAICTLLIALVTSYITRTPFGRWVKEVTDRIDGLDESSDKKQNSRKRGKKK